MFSWTANIVIDTADNSKKRGNLRLLIAPPGDHEVSLICGHYQRRSISDLISRYLLVLAASCVRSRNLKNINRRGSPGTAAANYTFKLEPMNLKLIKIS